MKKVIERFDPTKENCIPLSIDIVTYFLENKLYDKEKVEKIKSIKKILIFLEKKFSVTGAFYHPIFCFNPRYIKLFHHYNFRSIYFLRSKKTIEVNCAYIFFSCGNDLYDIPECWNHVVVELFGEKYKDRVYYDSYYDIVKQDYPNLNIKEPTHDELINKMVICLIVRKK